MAAERVEGADLRARIGHAHDAGGDFAKLGVGEGMVAQVDLRNLHFLVVGAVERAPDLRTRRGASQAGEDRGLRGPRGSHRGERRALQLRGELAAVVERAHELDLGEARGARRDQIRGEAHLLGAQLRGREPVEREGHAQHARTQVGGTRVAGEGEITIARGTVARDLVQGAREGRRLAVDVRKAREELLDAVEERAQLGSVAAQQPGDEGELLFRRLALVVELADVAPMPGRGVRITHAAHRHHAVGRELAQHARAGTPVTDLAGLSPAEVAAEDCRRRGPDRRGAREAVDHRHAGEHAPHAVAAALAIRRRVLRRVGIQALAAEEVDLLQVREEARARVAARGALQLVDLEEVVVLDLVGVERLAGVEMPGDNKDVALHAALAGAAQPIGAPLFHQLDELVLVLGQETAEHLALVRRVDGDGAHRLHGERARSAKRRSQCKQERGSRGGIHGEDLLQRFSSGSRENAASAAHSLRSEPSYNRLSSRLANPPNR